MQQRSFALITLAAGVLLCAIGFGAGMLSESTSLTRFIPLLFGVPILLCGVVALANAKFRKHAVHVALVFALIALLGSAGKIPDTVRSDGSALALASQVLMLIVSAGYIALGIKSFVNARAKRKAQEALAKKA